MTALTIALDASRTTVARRTGTEAYALALLRGLLALDTPHHWQLYFRDDPPADLFDLRDDVTTAVIRRARLWSHLGLGAALRQHQPDGVFIPAHVLPLFTRTPSVVTVHDLGYRHFPDAHTWQQRWYLELSTRYSARFATHLLADSDATRRDLMRFYDTPGDKITVVYPGIDETLSPVRHPSARSPVLQHYQLDEPYFLHVGTLQPRKNLIRLLDAYAPLADRALLVLAGKPGWLSAPIVAHIEALGLGNRVRLTGYVPDADLPVLYSAALAFVLPSLFEGFGFPVLEAMACGAPVICSNGGSLPEVAGEAALRFNADDTAALRALLVQVLEDRTLRQRLMIAGYQQAAKYRWDKTARHTLAVLEQIFGERAA